MRRLTISLPALEYEYIESRAEEIGVSKSKLIRDIISQQRAIEEDEMMEEQPLQRQIAGLQSRISELESQLDRKSQQIVKLESEIQGYQQRLDHVSSENIPSKELIEIIDRRANGDKYKSPSTK